MIAIGKYHTLKVTRRVRHGAYLAAGGEAEVLLPTKYVPMEIREGEEIRVFVYLDNGGRPVATTLQPHCTVGDFAFLRVRQVNRMGAFLDWGVEKDLLVPYAEQSMKMEEGRSYVVHVFIDPKSRRIMASSRLRRYVQHHSVDLMEGEAVEMLISGKSQLGTLAIVNNRFQGLLYKSETYKVLRVGEKLKGYVKKVREDGKIDLSLQQIGYAHVDDNAQKILAHLKIRDGFLDLHDKSDPDVIKRRMEMSKKTFKKALGQLYKEGLVELLPHGVRLKQK